MRFPVTLPAVLLALAACTPAAHADVLYQVYTYFPSNYLAFDYSFSLPNFVTTSTVIAAANVTFSTPIPCGVSSVGIAPSGSTSTDLSAVFTSGCQYGSERVSVSGPITGDGTYVNSAQLQTRLVVSGSPSVSAVPEPSSLALIGTGLIGAAAMLRRRLTL